MARISNWIINNYCQDLSSAQPGPLNIIDGCISSGKYIYLAGTDSVLDKCTSSLAAKFRLWAVKVNSSTMISENAVHTTGLHLTAFLGLLVHEAVCCSHLNLEPNPALSPSALSQPCQAHAYMCGELSRSVISAAQRCAWPFSKGLRATGTMSIRRSVCLCTKVQSCWRTAVWEHAQAAQ
jgi:hypothetical protein